jgi:hypothetical protein
MKLTKEEINNKLLLVADVEEERSFTWQQSSAK